MSTFFVVNPTAGRGRGKKAWEAVATHLDGWGSWSAGFTTAPGEGTRLARRAAEAGYDRVVALGGDGTVLEVLNGLVGSKTALGIVPAGTGNDYAREVGLPLSPLAAAHFAMTARPLETDIGQVSSAEHRLYYLNVAGVGFDAEVARTVNDFPKYLGGTLPYLVGLAKTLWRYRPMPMDVVIDGQIRHERVFLAAAGLSRSFGGGMRITPDALVDDGLLDLCLATDLSPVEVLSLVPKIYKGRHRTHPKIHFYRCREVEFRPAAPVATQADGEICGDLPARVRVLPAAIRLVSNPHAPVRALAPRQPSSYQVATF